MKNKVLRISLLLAAAVWVALGFSFKKNNDTSIFDTAGMELYFHVPTEEEANYEGLEVPINYNLFLGKTFIGFKEAVGFKESRGDYSTVNQYGYLGKYQFGRGTLQMIGVYNSDRFLNDTRLQEAAFTAYTARNKWILRRDIDRYVGRHIGGVKVTESGILAAAHLAGAGNVKRFLRSGGVEGFSDANGTTIRYYLKKFSGYDTSMIKPNKEAKVL